MGCDQSERAVAQLDRAPGRHNRVLVLLTFDFNALGRYDDGSIR